MLDELQSVLPMTARDVDGVLHVGGVSVRELARAYGTPVIAYDGDHIERSARAWLEAVARFDAGATVAYASKAFSSVGLLRMLGALGLGADVASLGELEVALRAGIDPQQIVLHGNNKSRADITRAIDVGVGLIVLDAEQELDVVEQVAHVAGRTQPVLVRLNPDVEVETHRYISTSHAGSKFGVAPAVAARMLQRASSSRHLDAAGVHVHLGSQLLDTAPWTTVVTWLGSWAATLQRDAGIALRVLDVGGGLGIAYESAQRSPGPEDVADAIRAGLACWPGLGLQLPHLIVEPGRSIVGSAAVTIYSVGVVKETGADVRYVNVDGGMSDNPRPMLYQARYQALLGERLDAARDGLWWVAGVHCESGDVLIEDAPLPRPEPGELLVIPATGAYAASMASTYNLVPRCAAVLVSNGSHRELLRRDTLADVLARDVHAQDSTEHG